MSSVNAPFGLQPSFHPSGYIRQALGTILSTYATTLYQYAPVQIQADGSLGIAAAGARSVGVFLGCQYYTVDNRYVVSNQWVGGTTLAANTTATAWYTEDPNIVYSIQANGSLALSDVGGQFNWTTATSGNATTGLSSVALDTASGGANKGLRVIGITPGPDNAFGDAYTVVQVQMSMHQYVADIAAV